MITILRGFLFLCIPAFIAAYLFLFIWMCVVEPWKLGTVIMGIALVLGASYALGLVADLDKLK